MEPARTLTDEHVLRALMRHPRLTRAELATVADISKPTAGESVRRLAEAGLVVDTGERTPGGRGRGRVGSYYALAPDIGTALAVDIAPEGVVAERVDAYGETVARAAEDVRRPAEPDQVAAAVRAAVTTLGTHSSRLAVVSAADPVDRASGRLVQLPDSPFLVGALDPVEILRPHVGGPITVDNDVNWAAQAERPATNYAYLYLGEGLGGAVVDDGVVRRGHSGLVGEIAHLLTTGPDGRAMPLIEVFGELGLRRAGSTAIDVERLLGAAPPVRQAVASAVTGVLAAVIALSDPEVIVLGGAWGGHPAMVEAIGAASAQAPAAHRSAPRRSSTGPPWPAPAAPRSTHSRPRSPPGPLSPAPEAGPITSA